MSLTSIDPRFRLELYQRWQAVFYRWRWLLHIILWVLVLLSLHVIEREIFGNIPAVFFYLVFFCGILFTYTFLLWIIPYARYRRSIWRLVLSVSLIGIAWSILLLKLGFYYFSKHPDIPVPFSSPHRDNQFAGFALVIFYLTIWLFCACYYFIELYDQQRNLDRYQAVLSDKLKAEMAFLQTQVNPHFLFNTINNIYLLTLKQQDNAPVIARRLKELLRYMLYDCTLDKVPLEGEIEFIKNYISLEELRNRYDAATIKFDVQGDVSNKMITPLLLINFVENAFKHGVKGGIGPVRVNMLLQVTGSSVLFDVSNSKPAIQPATAGLAVNGPGGIGIANVRRRLQIMYPQRHGLSITETAETFNVHLNIRL